MGTLRVGDPWGVGPQGSATPEIRDLGGVGPRGYGGHIAKPSPIELYIFGDPLWVYEWENIFRRAQKCPSELPNFPILFYRNWPFIIFGPYIFFVIFNQFGNFLRHF